METTTRSIQGHVESISDDGRSATVRYVDGDQTRSISVIMPPPQKRVTVGTRVHVQVQPDRQIACITGIIESTAKLPPRKQCSACGSHFFSKSLDGCKCNAGAALLP